MYQTNNRIFRDVFLSIIAAIAGIYYAVAKALGSPKGLQSYDWVILAALCVAAVYFITSAVKRSQSVEQDNYTLQ